MKLQIFLTAFLVCLSGLQIAQAATLSSLGASNVEIDGSFYNATFADGFCGELFSGCDNANDDFVFKTIEEATSASLALLNLFNSPGNEAFTLNPELINDCDVAQFGDNPYSCWIMTPYATDGGFWQARAFINYNSVDGDTQFGGYGSLVGLELRGADTFASGTFAIWSPVSPVPIPASLPLLVVGLAGLAIVKRRQRKTR